MANWQLGRDLGLNNNSNNTFLERHSAVASEVLDMVSGWHLWL